MTRTTRAPNTVTCSACGRVSHGGPHYCLGCGFDFWRSTPRTAGPAGVVAASRAVPAGRRSSAMVLGGIVGLAVTAIGVVVLVVSSMDRTEGPHIVNTLPLQGPDDLPVERFFLAARDPDAEFTVVSEGILLEELAGRRTEVQKSLTIRAADWKSHETLSSEGESREASAAEVDGKYFERAVTDSGWVSAENPVGLESASPFARISTVDEIDHVGSEVSGGATVHHLLVTKWLAGPLGDSMMTGSSSVLDRESRFDIWVNDAGIPIRATHVATITYEVGTAIRTIESDLRLTFSDWGDIEQIQTST